MRMYLKKGIALLLALAMLLCLPETPEATILGAEGALSDTIMPYSYLHAAAQTSSIEMSGLTFNDAIVFTMGYTGTSDGNTAQANYNFKGEYSSFSFRAGYYSGDERNASMTVLADGVTVLDSVSIAAKDVSKTYTVNLSGVSHLSIVFNSGGYDKTRYAIGNLLMTPLSTKQENETLETNMFYNCEPYFYQNASAVNETFDMGGYTYNGGINMQMGYTGLSSGGTSIVSFNFDKHYRSMSFDLGRYANSTTRNASFSIVADDETLYDGESISWDDIPRKITLDLSGVEQLTITLNSDGYDKVKYRMGNIQLVSDGVLRGIVFKKTSATLTSSNPTFQLEPVIVPADAKEQGYTLKSDSSITAQVDEDTGLVTGRHKGTAIITATTNTGGFTAECKITSKLPAAGYVPSVDGWGFTNQRVNIFQNDLSISDYYKNVYKRISGEAALYSLSDMSLVKAPNGPMYMYYTLCGAMATGGLCHGYSVLSALTYTGDIQFSTWGDWGDTSPTDPGDIRELSDTKGYSSDLQLYLKQALFACFVSQGSKTYIVNEALHKNKYDDLITAAKNFQETGKNPIVIKMYGNGAHSVVPYEVVEKDNETDVYIYDCNLDSDPDDNKIIFQKNSAGKIISWSYDSNYSSAVKDGAISYFDSLSTIADRLKDSAALEKVTRVLATNAKSFSVIKNGNTIAQYSGGHLNGEISGTEIIPLQFASDSKTSTASDTIVFAVLTDDPVTLQIDDGETEATTLFGDADSAFSVTSNGGAKITDSTVDDKKNLTVNPGSDGVVTFRYNYGEDKAIKVTGNTDSQISATATDDSDDLAVTGYKSLQVTEIEDDKETTGDTVTIDSDETYTVKNGIKKTDDDSSATTQKVKKITISGLSNRIAAGKKVQLKATLSPKNATKTNVTWKSSNKKIATVNSKGLVTVKKTAGGKSVKITATANDGSGVKAVYNLKIMKGAVKSVKITGKKTVKAGKSIKLKANVKASSGANKKLKWSSSNNKYASVSSSGKITAKKSGKGKTVKITALATDGSGKKATINIKIK